VDSTFFVTSLPSLLHNASVWSTPLTVDASHVYSVLRPLVPSLCPVSPVRKGNYSLRPTARGLLWSTGHLFLLLWCGHFPCLSSARDFLRLLLFPSIVDSRVSDLPFSWELDYLFFQWLCGGPFKIQSVRSLCVRVHSLWETPWRSILRWGDRFPPSFFLWLPGRLWAVARYRPVFIGVLRYPSSFTIGFLSGGFLLPLAVTPQITQLRGRLASPR